MPTFTTTNGNRMSEPVPQHTATTTQEEAISRSMLPPLSTYWVPLHEFRDQWAAFGRTIPDFPLALSATGHAFFALSYERRAHQHFARLPQAGARLSLTDYWQHFESTCKQVERDLHDAAHHWSRAAFCLDQLLAHPLTCEECALVRTHSRAARWQQERLWALLDEVQRDIATWRAQDPHEEHTGTPVQQQEATTR